MSQNGMGSQETQNGMKPYAVLLTEPYWHANLSKPILLGILGHITHLNFTILEIQVLVLLFNSLVNQKVDFYMDNRYIAFNTPNIPHFAFKNCWY